MARQLPAMGLQRLASIWWGEGTPLIMYKVTAKLKLLDPHWFLGLPPQCYSLVGNTQIIWQSGVINCPAKIHVASSSDLGHMTWSWIFSSLDTSEFFTHVTFLSSGFSCPTGPQALTALCTCCLIREDALLVPPLISHFAPNCHFWPHCRVGLSGLSSHKLGNSRARMMSRLCGQVLGEHKQRTKVPSMWRVRSELSVARVWALEE